MMKHFSYFVKPGAKRIKISVDFEDRFISFKNPDGSLVCNIAYVSDESRKNCMEVGNESFELNLDGNSAYIFTLTEEK